MRCPREDFELALTVDRVARTAGYTGWHPPESPDPPDPSELYWSALRLFPRRVQRLLGKPKEKTKHQAGDVIVSLTAEADLSEDSGVELCAISVLGEDIDEDGSYGYARDNLDYTLWIDGKYWTGEGEHKLAVDLREFERYLEQHDSAGHQAFSKMAAERKLRQRVAMMGGMFKKLKIKHVEYVRTDTYKVTADAGKQDGELRITVYPNGQMLVMGNSYLGSEQYLQTDLSDQAQKQVLKAVKNFQAKQIARSSGEPE